MIVCLYIYIFIIHFSTGCNLTNDRKTIEVTGYTGGSVLLPCSCDDPQFTVNTFKWEIHHNGSQWINALEYEKYRGRLKMFNEKSPANLSLLITDLREEDDGYYSCLTGPRSFTDVSLTVKGCDLVQTQNGKPEEVTGYLGESVVLPCTCTEPLAKPDQLKWKFTERHYEEIYPSERYKNRAKLLNQTKPGNLSLHLSSLTKEDQGYYQCSASSNNYIYIRLHVEEKPQVYTIYASTYQPSQQTHELITTQQPEDRITHQTHNTTLYIFILMGLFSSVLVFLVFNSWGCKGVKNMKKVISDAPKLSREPENEDEAVFSGVFYVNQHQHQLPCRMVQQTTVNIPSVYNE